MIIINKMTSVILMNLIKAKASMILIELLGKKYTRPIAGKQLNHFRISIDKIKFHITLMSACDFYLTPSDIRSTVSKQSNEQTTSASQRFRSNSLIGGVIN